MRRATPAVLALIAGGAAGCNSPSSLTGPDIAPALECGGYPLQATSSYLLPFAVGRSS